MKGRTSIGEEKESHAYSTQRSSTTRCLSPSYWRLLSHRTTLPANLHNIDMSTQRIIKRSRSFHSLARGYPPRSDLFITLALNTASGDKIVP